VCFSPEADFVSAAAIGVVGVATLTKARSPREVPLAALPLAFAVHQFAEGFVWLSLQGRISPSVGDFALHVYVLYAWAMLPVVAPLAVALVEADDCRRRVMYGFVALGALVSGYLLWSIVHESVSARIVEHTIQYRGVGGLAGLATFFYVVAICGTLLVSSHRRIVWFGVVNLVAVIAIVWIQADALTSLWCTWAAIVSVLIYMEFAERGGTDDALLSRTSGAPPSG
jgi:Family of unknown function (DUF6629)